uniref:Uncharacterized protein n=1 Tax=Panagrolaimus sp. PS1159 TaxID=55785 RepID=A0AC35F6M3_9BILA
MSETADFKRLKLFDPVDGSKNIINSNFLSCNNDKEKDYMDDKKDMQSLNIDDYISLKYGPSEKKVIVPHKTPHKIKNVIYLKQTYSTKANNSHKAVVGLSSILLPKNA